MAHEKLGQFRRPTSDLWSVMDPDPDKTERTRPDPDPDKTGRTRPDPDPDKTERTRPDPDLWPKSIQKKMLRPEFFFYKLKTIKFLPKVNS